jgi:glycine cleavage system aminomethyltransferase T
MTQRSLEDLLAEHQSPVEMLRNSQAGPNVYPGVPAEFTNWRDEQWAWQNTCVLFNQSHHMADLAVRGPHALALLTRLGINSFETFAVNKAKQFGPCTPEGYVIGDMILFYPCDLSLAESRVMRRRCERDACASRPRRRRRHRRRSHPRSRHAQLRIARCARGEGSSGTGSGRSAS